jgi:hypothetical protein
MGGYGIYTTQIIESEQGFGEGVLATIVWAGAQVRIFSPQRHRDHREESLWNSNGFSAFAFSVISVPPW